MSYIIVYRNPNNNKLDTIKNYDEVDLDDDTTMEFPTKTEAENLCKDHPVLQRWQFQILELNI